MTTVIPMTRIRSHGGTLGVRRDRHLPVVDRRRVAADGHRRRADGARRSLVHPRARPRYVRRNALVVLGNTGRRDDPRTESWLRTYLSSDDDLLVGHAAWAAIALGLGELLDDPRWRDIRPWGTSAPAVADGRTVREDGRHEPLARTAARPGRRVRPRRGQRSRRTAVATPRRGVPVSRPHFPARFRAGRPSSCSWATTVVQFVVTLIAAIDPDDFIAPFFVVMIVWFFAGSALFIVDLVLAAARSRDDAMGIGGLFFLAGSAPPTAQRNLLASLGLSIAVAVAGAAVRPFTPLAFGILAPMLPLALCGWWGVRHGYFPTRAEFEGRTGR